MGFAAAPRPFQQHLPEIGTLHGLCGFGIRGGSVSQVAQSLHVRPKCVKIRKDQRSSGRPEVLNEQVCDKLGSAWQLHSSGSTYAHTESSGCNPTSLEVGHFLRLGTDSNIGNGSEAGIGTRELASPIANEMRRSLAAPAHL